MTLANRIIELVKIIPGATDREITDRLFNTSTHPSQVNQTCRQLLAKGLLQRSQRLDGRIGNYCSNVSLPLSVASNRIAREVNQGLSEDQVKEALQAWLIADGWEVDIAWGKARGIDVLATREGERWIIEAKGCGSLSAMRVNYFLAVIGETLQRMHDPEARYSIAMPDMKQFRGLWERLPQLAKARTRLTAIFVKEGGEVEEVR